MIEFEHLIWSGRMRAHIHKPRLPTPVPHVHTHCRGGVSVGRSTPTAASVSSTVVPGTESTSISNPGTTTDPTPSQLCFAMCGAGVSLDPATADGHDPCGDGTSIDCCSNATDRFNLNGSFACTCSPEAPLGDCWSFLGGDTANGSTSVQAAPPLLYRGGVYDAGTERIYGVPFDADAVLVLDPATRTTDMWVMSVAKRDIFLLNHIVQCPF